MKSKKLFLSVIINIVLIIALSISLSCTIKQRKVKQTTINILDEMIKEIDTNISNKFQYFEMRKYFIEEDIDSFYLIYNQKSILNLKRYYNEIIKKPIEAEILFNIINSLSAQSQDYLLIKKIIEYRILKKIQENTYMGFVWFDGIGVSVFPKNDTITLGTEYVSEITNYGIIFNKKELPFIVIDNDTIIAEMGQYTFREKATKKGIIKHKGYMYLPQGNSWIKFPIDFEYYVK